MASSTRSGRSDAPRRSASRRRVAAIALVAASLSVPAKAGESEAKAKALADAELALANARATTLAALVKKILPGSDGTKIAAVAASMETRATARANRARP